MRRFVMFLSIVFCAVLTITLHARSHAGTGCVGTAKTTAGPDDCPVFTVLPVSIDVLCTPQEFKEHTFMDTIVTNVSSAPISGYTFVVAMYDASGKLLVSQRVERKARKGLLAPGESQDERFIAVDVPPAKVVRVEVTPVPKP